MKRADARVLVVGAGGLGSPAAHVLARAGVGEIALLDDDRVEASNLHRQILHRAEDAGRLKVESAADALARISPSVRAVAIAERLTPANAAMVRNYHVVLDGSDGFATKFLVNDACVLARVPFVHAAAIRWTGQLLPVAAGAPCYRCLFEEPPPPAAGATCSEAGIAGPVVGVIGALQAEAALALLDGKCDARESVLTRYDGLAGRARSVRFRRNRACRACHAMTALDPRDYQVTAC